MTIIVILLVASLILFGVMAWGGVSGSKDLDAPTTEGARLTKNQWRMIAYIVVILGGLIMIAIEFFVVVRR